MIAALQSELGFLSNPAGTHVQSAEMRNQALNSLRLISARYTHTALKVLSQLASAHLFRFMMNSLGHHSQRTRNSELQRNASELAGKV